MLTYQNTSSEISLAALAKLMVTPPENSSELEEFNLDRELQDVAQTTDNLVTESSSEKSKVNSAKTNVATILIVDDTPDNLLVLFCYLEEKGYKILLAEDGETALQIAQSKAPDLILLDVLMPDLNGFETCRRLKAKAATKDIPVIFLTAVSETVNKVQGFKLGGVDYISKPCEQEEVLARIQTHISLNQMRQRIVEQNHQLQRELEERQRITATLQESERRWRTLLENVRLMVVELKNNGKIEYVNPYFLEVTEYSQQEILGQNWFQIVSSPNQKQPIQKMFREMLQQQNQNHYHESIVTKSGMQKIIAWNNTLLKDTEGNVVGMTSIGKDITQQYLLQRMKDELMAIVSHELRTPLTLLQGTIGLLSQGSLKLETSKGQQINKTKDLAQLVNNISLLENLAADKFQLSPQQINVTRLLRRVRKLIELEANKKKIAIAIRKHTALKIDANEELILYVSTELVRNAIKYSQANSTIWLNVERQKEGNNSLVLFSVKDTGEGIIEEQLNQIFERFCQLDGSDSRSQG